MPTTFKTQEKDKFAGDSLVRLDKYGGFIKMDNLLFLETKKYQIDVSEMGDMLVRCGKDEANFKKQEASEGKLAFSFPKAFLSREKVELDVLVKDGKISIATGDLARDLRKAGLDVDGNGYMGLSAFEKVRDLQPTLHLGKDELKWCGNVAKHSYEVQVMAGLIPEVEKLWDSQMVKDFLESKVPIWGNMVVEKAGEGFRGNKVYNKGENASGVIIAKDGTEVEVLVGRQRNTITLDFTVREPNTAEMTAHMSFADGELNRIAFQKGKTRDGGGGAIELDMDTIRKNLKTLKNKPTARELFNVAETMPKDDYLSKGTPWMIP
jgi:hypothetical protein